MIPGPTTVGNGPGSANEAAGRERGSALLLALFMVVILTLIGFGLLTRTLMVSQIAGSERWSVKSFYAADSGLQTALQRARLNQTAGFQFSMQDLRGAGGSRLVGNIAVNVDPLQRVAAPQPVLGSQLGGGQGSGDLYLYVISYAGRSTSNQQLTRTRRVVSNIFTVGPVPLVITGN
jgi:hypothetical protein